MVDWKGTQKVASMERIPAAMSVVRLDGYWDVSKVVWSAVLSVCLKDVSWVDAMVVLQ